MRQRVEASIGRGMHAGKGLPSGIRCYRFAVVPRLETIRLNLVPLQMADAAEIQALFPDWEIVKYLNAAVPWPYPADGAETWCRDRALPDMERGDAWHWTLRLKTHAEQVIGVIKIGRAHV